MNSVRHLFCFLIYCLLAIGCSPQEQSLDQRTFPYKLEIARELDVYDRPFDLDGDGEDEIISMRINTPTRLTAPPSVSAIIIKNHHLKVIEQVNFDGEVLEPKIHDVENDGKSEIFVPFIRDDSLFLSIINLQGRKLWNLFIVEGAPRVEPDGVIPWDPIVRGFYTIGSLPLDSLYLVSIVNTGLARAPRGVFIHRLANGHLLGSSIIGAAIYDHILSDLDGDDSPELIINSHATNNGNTSGGFDDQHSYIIAYDLNPKPEIIWSTQIGDTWTSSGISLVDIDKNGHKELLSFMTSAANVADKSRIELVQLNTWTTYLGRNFNQAMVQPVFIDLDRDTRQEIITSSSPGKIAILNEAFEITKERNLGFNLGSMLVLPDMDNDGISELITRSYQDILLLDPSLNIKAIYPRGINHGSVSGMFHRNNGMSPYLFVNEETRNIALELLPNKFYWIYKYGPIAFWLLLCSSFPICIIAISRTNRKRRTLQLLHDLLIERDDRAIFMMNSQKDILWKNDTFVAWFLDNRQAKFTVLSIDQTLGDYPNLLNFLIELCNRSTSSLQSFSSNIDFRLENELCSITASLIPSGYKRDIAWLITISKKVEIISPEQAKVWTLMAERTVHDIKNPLTSILLTVQRLQDAYKQKAPELKVYLDGYTDRIIQQVDHLRGKTQSFLKFVDLEEPEFILTDINSYLLGQRTTLENYLPQDIQLTFNLGKDIPSVPIDQAQISSVLENLVSNSINAMLSGGTITISSRTVRTLQFSPNDQKNSFLILEIMDTGDGIPQEKKYHLFDIGNTTTRNGTGLGLAIVKKVIDLHQGHIEIESEKGIGTVFSIYLPIPTLKPNALKKHSG